MKYWFALLLLLGAFPVEAQLSLQQVCLDERERLCAWQANPQANQSVVLVHGLNGSAVEDWRAQIEMLSQSYHVLAIELPGFDDESGEASSYSMAFFSDLIRRFTSRYVGSDYALVGHSMGGVIALRHALYYQDEVKRLVLVDVAAVLHRISYTREMVGHWARRGTSERSGFSAILEKLTMKFISTGESLPGTNDSANEILLQHVTDPRALASMQLVRQDFSGQLPGMWVPTLLIWGEEDRIAPLRTGYTLNARLPNARLHIIPGAHHIPMREQPKAFNSTLLAFLQADSAAPNQGRSYLPSRGESESSRVVKCQEQSDQVYEGDFARIELRSCDRVVIRNARVRSLKVQNSRISVQHSHIGGAGTTMALEAYGADVKITASHLEGEIPLRLSGSRMDLAGTTMVSGSHAIKVDSGSELVFSLSELQTSGITRYLHGFFELAREVFPPAAVVR
ncbi:MAG TPA: alpha/beta hydrolase [Gammaproteobacteria bacterium]